MAQATATRDAPPAAAPHPRFRGRRPVLRSLPGLGVAALLAWSAVVAFSFVDGQWGLLAPLAGLARRAALCAALLGSLLALGGSAALAVPGLVRSCGRGELAVIALGLGTGGAMLLLLAAGLAGWLGPWIAWTVLLAPWGLLLLTGGPLLRARRDAAGTAPRGARGRAPGRYALFAVGGMSCVASLTPAVSQDALVYHLAVPARWIESGTLHIVEGNFFSAFPMNVELLFALGLLVDGEELAKWLHWLLGAGAAGAVGVLALRLAPRRGGRATEGPALPDPALAAALFATVPTVALIAGWAYVDLGVVFFCTLSTLALVRLAGVTAADRDDRTGPSACAWTGLAALFAGLAAGCKYTAGLQAVVVAGTVVALGVRARRPSGETLRRLAWAVVVAGVTAGPWYLRNALVTGNPVFPFAYGIFGGEGWDAERAAVLAASLREWGGERGLLKLLMLPWDVTVRGSFFSQEGFDGVIGFGFLAGAPLLLLGLRRPGSARVATAVLAAHVLLWVCTTHQIRFLLPALAIAAALLAAAVARLGRGWRRRLPEGVLHAACLLNVAFVAVHFAGHAPLPVVLGYESENTFRQREVPGGDWPVFRHIAEELPSGARILFGSCGGPGFLCKRPYRMDALFENFTLDRLLRETGNPRDFAERLCEEGFTHLLFRFDTVFDPSGRRSEIPLERQQLLSRFLNRHAEVEARANKTLLYRILPPGVER